MRVAETSQHYSTGIRMKSQLRSYPIIDSMPNFASSFTNFTLIMNTTNLKMPSSPSTLHLSYTSSFNAPFSAFIPIGPDSSPVSTKSSSNNLDISVMEALSPWYTKYAVRCIPPSFKSSVSRPTRLSSSPQPSSRPENFAPTTPLRVPPPRPSNFLCGIRIPTPTPSQT